MYIVPGNVIYFHECVAFYLQNSCFDRPTLEEILQALKEDGSEWALKQTEVMWIMFEVARHTCTWLLFRAIVWAVYIMQLKCNLT